MKRVRGIVRRRNSSNYIDLILPTILRIKWKQEEKIKNALLYGIGVPKPKNEFWGEGEVEGILQKKEESQADPEKLRLHNLLWVYREIVRSLLHECNKYGVAKLQKIAIQDGLDPDELALLGEAVWNGPYGTGSGKDEGKQEEVKPTRIFCVPPHLERVAKEIINKTPGPFKVVVDPTIPDDSWFFTDTGKEAPHATTKTNSPRPASEHEPDKGRG